MQKSVMKTVELAAGRPDKPLNAIAPPPFSRSVGH